jgi:D-serine deaminase-like pyridoxal phosphate-dependent protein
VALMVDCTEQVQQLALLWRELGLAQPLPVCVDADISWRPFGIHIGVQRSPTRTITAFERLTDEIERHAELRLAGVMTYEAQIAGVADALPSRPLRNRLVRFMKQRSGRDVASKRQCMVEHLRQRGRTVEFVNGGGSGSFSTAVADPCLTEVTVGSGLVQPHLFDHYTGPLPQPALCFALAVTRRSQHDRITCQSGGFIASGPAGDDRSPLPIFPTGLRADKLEGFGEVQTPLIVTNQCQVKLQIGDPVFFRPAKAGEIAERFINYCLVAGGQIIDQVPTYRGLGKCFH